MAILTDTLRSSINLRQRENENLQEYTRKFKTSREVLETHLGSPLILTKYVEGMDGYDVKDIDKRNDLQKKAAEQLMAYLYLDNTDKKKYGTIMTNLQSQKSLGNEQYPKTITEANNVLSNHKFDNFSRTTSNRENPRQNNDKNEKETDSKDEESPTLLFAQMEGK